MAKRTTTTITVRVDKAVRERLDRLAGATSRSRSFLAARALQEFVEANEWQIRAIEEGIASADAGDVVPHDDVERWLRTWGRLGECKRSQK